MLGWQGLGMRVHLGHIFLNCPSSPCEPMQNFLKAVGQTFVRAASPEADKNALQIVSGRKWCTPPNWNFVFPLFGPRPSKRCPLGVWEAKEAWFFSQPSPGPPRHFQWPSLTECDEPVSQLPQGVTPVLQLGVHQPGEERGSCDTLWLCVNSCDLGSEHETLQFCGPWENQKWTLLLLWW